MAGGAAAVEPLPWSHSLFNFRDSSRQHTAPGAYHTVQRYSDNAVAACRVMQSSLERSNMSWH